MGIIYQARNVLDSTLYIGKTIKTLRVRANQHCADAKANRYNTHFHKAIRKYGCNAFEWTVLAEVDNSVLNAAEIDYIELARDQGFNVYNMTDGGEGVTGSVGYKHSEKQKRLIGEASRNRVRTPEELERSGLARRKTYRFRSPDGQIYEIRGLQAFCQEYGLNVGQMSSLASGRIQSYKGWTLP